MATEYFNDAWRIPNNKNQSLVSNYSMEFDGSNINLGNAFEGTNEGYSISFWYNTSINQTNHIISKTSSNFEIYSFVDLTLYTYFGSKSKNTNRIPVVLNSWQHICYVVTSTEYKGYQNGVLTVTNAFTQTPVYTNNTSDVFLSSRAGGVSPWGGKLDQVTFFDYTLSASQVSTLYGGGTAVTNPMSLSPKPVAYYQLGDQSVSTGPSADYLVPNNSLQDYVFSFTNSSIILANEITLPDNKTTSFWVKWNAVPQTQFAVVLSSSTSLWFPLVGKNGLGNFILYYKGSNAQLAITTTVPAVADVWYNFVTTGDGSIFNVYINGINAYAGGAGTDRDDVKINQISSKPSGGFFVDGQMSNVAIWSGTTLSSTEVTEIYNQGSPLNLNTFSGNAPTAWWKLNAQDTFDGANWTIKDYAGSNDGTSVGMTSANLVQSNLQHTSGYSPYALSLDGTSNFFKLGTASDSTLGGSTSFTVTAWVKPINNSQLQYIFGSWGGGVTTRSYSLGTLTSNKIRFQLFSTDASTTILDSSTNEISYGVWQNITVTYDGTNLKMFKNGIEDASSVVINNKVVYNSLYADSIGRRSSVAYANYFYGDISNCAIWRNSVINPVTIYNNGVPANLNNLSTKPSYWWQLGSNSSFDANTSKWTCLNEGTERTDAAPVDAITGVANMTNDDITNGVGYSGNGLGTSSIEIIGDAPYSTANGLSENMDVLDRTTDLPPTV